MVVLPIPVLHGLLSVAEVDDQAENTPTGPDLLA